MQLSGAANTHSLPFSPGSARWSVSATLSTSKSSSISRLTSHSTIMGNWSVSGARPLDSSRSNWA